VVICGSTAGVPQFGMQSGATDNFDTGIDIVAPPAAPSGADTYFSSITGQTAPYDRLLKDCRAISYATTTWRFLVKVPDTCSATATCNSSGVPAGVPLSWQEADASWNGTGTVSDLKTMPITVPTNSSGNTVTKRYLIRAGAESFTFSLAASPSWNLMSFPISPSSTDPATVIGPNIIGIFEWSGSGYAVVSTIMAKKGYWVLVSQAVTNKSVTGTAPGDGCACHLVSGWNLIGPRGNPRGNPQPAPPPPAWAMACFGWSGSGYVVPASCQEGNGYWMLATQAGDLWP
jgi:hypothetical protein